MPLSDKAEELARLVLQFESEVAKYHPLTLAIFFVTQDGESLGRQPNLAHHAVMLWQHYGHLVVNDDNGIERFVSNLNSSDLQWGIRGAKLSKFALLEGETCSVFVRMAQRAGALFDKDEASIIDQRLAEEVDSSAEPADKSHKRVTVTNSNPLAIWLNFLLYHLSLTYPGRERSRHITPDPFTLSLLALERLSSDCTIGKVDRSSRKLSDIVFRVALSFPGEHRPYVANLARILSDRLGPDTVFYDFDYQAQLARPNMDTKLQDIYRHRSELVVVFLCGHYAEKDWCGLEWRGIRDMIKAKKDDQVMLVRFDDAPIEGVFSIDGYIDARGRNPSEMAGLILDRLNAQSTVNGNA